MITDRLNQPLDIYDLVLISHPKTSVLLRCMVVKIMTKTVKVVVLPESELENETAQYCQKTMADVGDGKWHGNVYKSKIGFNRKPEEVVKIGHSKVPSDLSETEEAVAAELMDIKVGDPNLWVNRKNLIYLVQNMETLVTTDITNKEVRIGDTVLVAHTDSNNLYHAKVIDITLKRIKCKIFNAPKSYRYLNDKVVQRLSEQIIKISD